MTQLCFHILADSLELLFLSFDISVDLLSQLHNLLLPLAVLCPPPAHPTQAALIHCTVARPLCLPNTNLLPSPWQPFAYHRCPGKRRGRASERAGDLERGSIRNLKINALSARKSMGLIGMPIGPVKTIKREEKCLTTFPDSRHGGGERESETDGGA